jgi:hypothetical protein
MQLQSFIQPEKHTKESGKEARKLIRALLQSKESLESAFEDICLSAIEEGVTCKSHRTCCIPLTWLDMEVMVDPLYHTATMTPEEVLVTVLESRKAFSSKHSLTSGIVVYVPSSMGKEGNFLFDNA